MSGSGEPLTGERDTRRQRDAAFLDRVEEYAHLERHLETLAGDPRHLVVVGMSGLGGIGKTRFLEEVASRFARLPRPPTVVSIALGGSAFSTLVSVREQVGAPCYLFDVAATVYGAVSGQAWPQVDRLRAWLAEPSSQGSGDDTLPVTFAVDCFDRLDSSDPDLVLRRGYERSAFAAVDALRARPDELHGRLPSLLGGDIGLGLADPDLRRLVFLYDAYERTSDAGPATGVDWLPPFVRSLGAGIHVITSRRPLEGGAAVWGTQVRQRTLDQLPEDECRRMIRREIGDHLRHGVEDQIVAASTCVPFYLHASIAVCRARLRERGTVDVEGLPSSSPAMVERLLHHLSEAERRLTVTLAAVQYFDQGLYQSLVRSLDLTDVAVRVGTFVEWFFVLEVEPELFRTHHLLTDLVRRGADLMEDARTALQSATEHLALRTADWRAPDHDRLTRMFTAVLEGCQAVDEVPTGVVERLVDIGYDLYDAGCWRELAALPVAEGGGADAARLVAQYFVALSVRRSDGPGAALAELEPLAPRRSLLGRHAASFDVEDAYLREIGGDYASARRRFRELDEAVTQFDGTRRDHVRVRLYHADMLTMDGRLQHASRLLLEAYEQLPAERVLDWTEFVRHRGHALRFSLDHVEAQHEYLRALDQVQEVPSLRGKLRTNLAESRCWVEPARAVEDAEQAIRLNERLGSRIEVAKARAALGVALSGTGRFDEARAACASALAEALQVGYPAGACFARQAEVVTEVRAGEPVAAARAYADLVTRVEELGTYRHLCLVPAWFLEDEAAVRHWSQVVDWTGSDDAGQRLQSLRR